MKALLLRTNETLGGAAKAASRMCKGLRSISVDAMMFVLNKNADESFATDYGPKNRVAKVFLSAAASLDSLPLHIYDKPPSFSLNWLPLRTVTKINSLQPDIVSIHWVNESFVNIESLVKLNFPLILTMHDMCFTTGGCHYLGSFFAYTSRCGKCPQLSSRTNWDISRHWTVKVGRILERLLNRDSRQ